MYKITYFILSPPKKSLFIRPIRVIRVPLYLIFPPKKTLFIRPIRVIRVLIYLIFYFLPKKSIFIRPIRVIRVLLYLIFPPKKIHIYPSNPRHPCSPLFNLSSQKNPYLSAQSASSVFSFI